MGVREAAMLACLFAWAGCGSGQDPSPPEESYLVLGDSLHDTQESDFAPSLGDSGLYIIWTSGKPDRINHEHLDSAGRYRGEESLSYPDSIAILSPSISAYPFPGMAMAWVEWDRREAQWRVAVQRGPEPFLPDYPVHPPLPGLREVAAASILALADTGFVLGIEGHDSSGTVEGIWIQRYVGRMQPAGEAWFLASHSIPGAPGLARRPQGGWTAVWSWYEGEDPEIAWQRFDASGNPDGPRRTHKPRIAETRILRIEPLKGGRLLIEARSGTGAPFIIGADGEAESDSTLEDARDIMGMAADTARGRIYGIRRNQLVRMDAAFRIGAARDLPAILSDRPEIAVLPSGKIALIGHGNGSRPGSGGHALLAVLVDPF